MLVSMNDILGPAMHGGYGIGFFNVPDVEMARAVFEAAEELSAPVIVGTAEALFPAMDLELVADYLLPMAKRASVPVAIHLDHGLSFEACMMALRLGFTSVMYDCSTLPYEENKQRLAEMVRICHAMGASVEGELGHVGDNFGEGQLAEPKDFYTDPAMARDFVESTGVDALAVAVGNAHGDYAFPPKLDFARVAEIRDAVHIPLVLHGGSGLADSDFQEAVQRGVCKVNIYTDLVKAGKAGAGQALADGAPTLTDMIPYEIDAMKRVSAEKMRLFGSAGRA